MKVTLIAPIAPFRGGIARHSSAVAQALQSRPEINFEVESFVRLYPTYLYPGESDRDNIMDSDIHFSFRTRYALDAINPLTWNEAAGRITKFPRTVAIMPVWTFFLAPALGWITHRLRRKAVTVVMIVHNATDHESSYWKSRLLNWQLAAADGFITHTDDLAQQLRKAGHAQPISVSPHPPYSDFPKPSGSLKREHALELLCFGLVRRYKGVDIALRALEGARLSDVRLTIAGELWEAPEELRALIDSPGLRGKVELIDRYVSDAEAAELFDRCDAVLAPYRSVTGSGVLAMAQHYKRPVIASDLPGFCQKIEPGRTGWLFPSGSVSALARLLRDDVTREGALAMQASLEQAAGKENWQDYCQSLLELVSETKQSKRGRA